MTDPKRQPIDHRPTIAGQHDPRNRQRHDIPWSQPLPLEPRTLADDPLPKPEAPVRHANWADEHQHCDPRNCMLAPIACYQPDGDPEPYTPKVGERARLVSSPDEITDSAKVGQEWTVTGIRQGTGEHEDDPSYYWRVRNELQTWDTFIHRDAVWEPVAAQEPTAEPAQPEAEAIRIAYAAWLNSRGSGMAYTEPTIFAAGFDVGLRRGREERKPPCDRCGAAERALGEDRAAHAAEVERLRLSASVNVELYEQASKAEAEVERLRGELAEKRALVADYERASKALRHELEARAERPEPSDRDLSVVLWEAWFSKKWGEAPTDAEAPYAWLPCDFSECARAAKSELLGVRREGVTREERAVIDAAKVWVAHVRRHGWAMTTGPETPLLDAVEALVGAEPKGQPEPAADDLDGMPTKWRERIEALERSDVALQRFVDCLRDRCGALELAVEGLKLTGDE